MEYDEFVEGTTIAMNQPRYCDGILFAITGFNETDKMKDEEAAGIYRFQTVAFTILAEKVRPKTIRFVDSNTELNVMDFSKFEFYQELAQYCRSHSYLEEQLRSEK